MARRKNEGLVEGLFDIAAMTPWWVGVGLAVVSYFVLHHFALTEIPVSPNPRDMAGLMVKQALKTGAMIGQYVLPLIFLAGAGASVMARRKRNQLHIRVAGAGSTVVLSDMS